VFPVFRRKPPLSNDVSNMISCTGGRHSCGTCSVVDPGAPVEGTSVVEAGVSVVEDGSCVVTGCVGSTVEGDWEQSKLLQQPVKTLELHPKLCGFTNG